VAADLHIADVVSVLDVEDLEDAVPLGHSYAGIVIAVTRTGAASAWARSSGVRAHRFRTGMAGRRPLARAAGAPAA
jgi:hypothetical protein